jgi:hypothetical protein
MRITKTKLVKIIKEELGGAMAEIDATAALLATIRDKLVHLDRTVLHDSTGATAEELSSRLDYTAEAIDEVVAMIGKWEEEDIDEYY